MLSLLLGLPTGTGHRTLPFQSVTSDGTLGHNLCALVGSLAGKILERNQLESTQEALDMTGKIDLEIILAGEQMPAGFWRSLAFAGLEKDSLEALNETRRAFGHMLYYSMVVQLHLPYMLSPYDASQKMYSKIACVNASREILIREVELRTVNRLSSDCRMGEFLALIAGMALMLGHITSHFGYERDHLLAYQRLGDRATVDRALGCVKPTSGLHGDVLADRCASLLRDLLTIEENAARRHSLRAGKPSDVNQRDILIMRVPYLGSIQISRDGVASLPAAGIDQSLCEGVTIGGIGSMTIGRPNQSLLNAVNENHGSTNITALPETPTSLGYDSSHPVSLAAISNSPMPSDPMFPDVLGGFDDWVFQGVDTAFMESLMRGSAVPPLDDFGDGTWGVSTFS